MAKEALTGSRIRERRMIAGLRQADLAQRIGISASYLNLIEHNRRRIGGKLLLDIAATLEVDPSVLTQGAEAALIASLREAALYDKSERAVIATDEIARVEEFAGRFPGWAGLLSAAHRRIAVLERTVETLSDRLTHDPHLAASLHELLSTAAAIRSTASILAEDKSITQEWRERFHDNLDQDSRRLAASSKSLVSYLDSHDDAGTLNSAGSPQEEVDAFFKANAYCFPLIEESRRSPEEVVNDAPQLVSIPARHMATAVLEQLSRDAASVRLEDLETQISRKGLDPLALSQHFSTPAALILRRLAALPALQAGLVVCDRSGSLLFRKPAMGFSIPRFGAVCPLWPVFDALAQAGPLLRKRVLQVGSNNNSFECYAVAHPQAGRGYNTLPLLQATMLVLPVPAEESSTATPDELGTTCRVCARQSCPARREPSILSEGF